MNTEYILHFIIYLIIYSFFGWVLESVSKTIEQRKLVNSGFLNGPFCPIYGFGAVIMILCLDSLKDSIILLFMVAFFVLSLWEYMVGIFLEKVFKTKYWDYSHLKFNIQGRVCLKNSLFWGVLGVIFIRYIHPCIEEYVQCIPMKIILYIDIIISLAILVDTIISIIAVTNFESTIHKLNDIGDTIKDKVEELKGLKEIAKQKTEEFEKNNIENIEKVIKELKINQTRLKIKIYRQANRLRKAFPSMKSEAITQFLSQKIDLKRLKENVKKKNKE